MRWLLTDQDLTVSATIATLKRVEWTPWFRQEDRSGRWQLQQGNVVERRRGYI